MGVMLRDLPSVYIIYFVGELYVPSIHYIITKPTTITGLTFFLIVLTNRFAIF